METLIQLLQKKFVKRLISLVFVGVLIFIIKKQIALFLMTFVFVFLVNTLKKTIDRYFGKSLKINYNLFITFLYLILAGLFFFSLYRFVPEMIREITEIINSITTYLEGYNSIINSISSYLGNIDLQQYIQNLGTMVINLVGSIGSVTINLVLAFLLSLFFLLEQDKITKFCNSFKSSRLGWLYEELSYFGEKFSNSFGKVVQTQILISFINSLLSLAIFVILGFPNVLGLFIMVFVLGLIPVAGVIISILPLGVIAYTIGGMKYIMLVFALIIVLHCLEAYILNPKLMSHKTNLPVFVTFLILILSDHFFGVLGLMIGIPLTMFFLDIFEVNIAEPMNNNHDSV